MRQPSYFLFRSYKKTTLVKSLKGDAREAKDSVIHLKGEVFTPLSLQTFMRFCLYMRTSRGGMTSFSDTHEESAASTSLLPPKTLNKVPERVCL